MKLLLKQSDIDELPSFVPEKKVKSEDEEISKVKSEFENLYEVQQSKM